MTSKKFKRLLSKIISYLILIIFLILSWVYFLSSLKGQGGEVAQLNRILKDRKEQIAKLQVEINSLQEIIDTKLYDKKTLNCNYTECLFSKSNNYEGFATITGYYQQTKITDQWGTDIQCNQFNVQSGNNGLTDNLRYNFDKDGNQTNFTNINISYLNPQQKLLLEQSSVNKPVKIGIIKTYQSQVNQNLTCYSDIQVITVND